MDPFFCVCWQLMKIGDAATPGVEPFPTICERIVDEFSHWRGCTMSSYDRTFTVGKPFLSVGAGSAGLHLDLI